MKDWKLWELIVGVLVILIMAVAIIYSEPNDCDCDYYLMPVGRTFVPIYNHSCGK